MLGGEVARIKYHITASETAITNNKNTHIQKSSGLLIQISQLTETKPWQAKTEAIHSPGFCKHYKLPFFSLAPNRKELDGGKACSSFTS